MRKVLVGFAALLVTAGPAFATNNGNGDATATATANGGTHVQTNTQVTTQGQSQIQGQQQGQIQGQGQGQRQSADNKGVSQSVKNDAPLIPGVAVAPGLTAGGSQVCLGSFSVGLSGPLAGVAFGKTVVDKGCEDRQNAILLFNMGFQTEALHLLISGNERVRALFMPESAAMAPGINPEAHVSAIGMRSDNIQGQ